MWGCKTGRRFDEVCSISRSVARKSPLASGRRLPTHSGMLDSHCQMAKEEGVLVAISSDAHSIQDLDNLIYGVGQARRGWLEKNDVLNTRSLKSLRPLLKRTMS